MKSLKYVLTICIFSIIACSNIVESDSKNWVFDNENILTEQEENNLNNIIVEFEKKSSNEIVIVTTDNIGKHSKMVFYAVEFGTIKGVGKKNKDNGLVIVVSKELRETFLATGKSTENILKDEICKQIVDNRMVPYFTDGDFYIGIKNGLEESIRIWKKQ